MTVQEWDVHNLEIEIIVEHLKEHHSVGFHHRASLSDDEFLEEHFPELLVDMQNRDLIFEGQTGNRERRLYLGAEGKRRLTIARKKMNDALKFCEENGIPIAKVFDFNHRGESEWRICKPTAEQLAYLKFIRWYKIIEGLANKSLLQGNLIEETSIDEVLREIKESIIEGQGERQEERDRQRVVVEVTPESESNEEETEEEEE